MTYLREAIALSIRCALCVLRNPYTVRPVAGLVGLCVGVGVSWGALLAGAPIEVALGTGFVVAAALGFEWGTYRA